VISPFTRGSSNFFLLGTTYRIRNCLFAAVDNRTTRIQNNCRIKLLLPVRDLAHERRVAGRPRDAGDRLLSMKSAVQEEIGQALSRLSVGWRHRLQALRTLADYATARLG
jgi:hypothetical protein